MNDPVVVVVSKLPAQPGRAQVWLAQPTLSEPEVLDCTGTEPEFATLRAPGVLPDNAVSDAGARLYAGLAANPAVKAELDKALGIRAGERRPLVLWLLSPDPAIKDLPWETVYPADDPGFLGLDPRWSVGRRVESNEGQPTAVLATPLRIAAVLSCLGNPARTEWEKLREAVEGVADRLPVQVLLFLSETDLQDDIEAAGRPEWLLPVQDVPASAEELRERFAGQRFDPHVLHFFCHGSTTDGPHLQIATRSDWDRDPPQSSLTMVRDDIDALSTPVKRPWLVVLNCCLGAAGAGPAGAPTQSLAAELVRSGGYPAAIGMREAVDVSDAATFTARFYPEVFAALAKQDGGQPTVPDWSRMLITARRRLAEEQGANPLTARKRRRQWTLPVLFQRYRAGSGEFTVTVAAELQTVPPGSGPAVPPGTPPPGPGAPPQTPPVNEAFAALLHDLLAVSGPDAPAAWTDELRTRLAALGGAQ